MSREDKKELSTMLVCCCCCCCCSNSRVYWLHFPFSRFCVCSGRLLLVLWPHKSHSNYDEETSKKLYKTEPKRYETKRNETKAILRQVYNENKGIKEGIICTLHCQHRIPFQQHFVDKVFTFWPFVILLRE